MPLTTDQVVAAEAAKRMLADEAFQRVLTRITENAASKALFDDGEATREANRQLVLAISRIQNELKYDADLPEAVKAGDELAKSFE